MNTNEWIHIITNAALALLIIISLFWWVFALAHGVFALGPFLAMLAGLTITGITSKKDRNE